MHRLRRLRGPWRRWRGNTDEFVQRCGCERSAQAEREAVWPGYDHNTVAELCRCCAIEIVRSGSKWSTWFCPDCRERVTALNARMGRCVVPIGRHSLMNGVSYRPVPGGMDDEALTAFADQLHAFFEAAGDTDGWRLRILTGHLAALGLTGATEVPMRDYLARAARAGLSKTDAFAALAESAGGPPGP